MKYFCLICGCSRQARRREVGDMCDKKQQHIRISYRYNYVVMVVVDAMKYQTCICLSWVAFRADRLIALSDDCTSLSSTNPPATTTTSLSGGAFSNLDFHISCLF